MGKLDGVSDYLTKDVFLLKLIKPQDNHEEHFGFLAAFTCERIRLYKRSMESCSST